MMKFPASGRLGVGGLTPTRLLLRCLTVALKCGSLPARLGPSHSDRGCWQVCSWCLTMKVLRLASAAALVVITQVTVAVAG